jgi:hypothetical protein
MRTYRRQQPPSLPAAQDHDAARLDPSAPSVPGRSPAAGTPGAGTRGFRPVPYIARCKGESPYAGPLVLAGGRIAYPDMRSADRGVDDVLILRSVGTPAGPVRAADIDPGRQFRAMGDELLCQGCGGPSARRPGSQARLWALPVVEQGRQVDPAGLCTESPPVCVHCVIGHLPRCPVMRPAHQLLWVSQAPVVGVMAILRPPPLGGRQTKPQFLRLPSDIEEEGQGGGALDRARAEWDCAVAVSLVRKIVRYSPADPRYIADLAAGSVEQPGNGLLPGPGPAGEIRGGGTG